MFGLPSVNRRRSPYAPGRESHAHDGDQRDPRSGSKATYAELLKQGILKSPEAKGIYHAEPNITTASLLVKFHPAFHETSDVIELVGRIAEEVGSGGVEFSAKHKNPRLGKMPPSAFFTRELVVSVIGNVLGGLLLALMLTR